MPEPTGQEPTGPGQEPAAVPQPPQTPPPAPAAPAGAPPTGPEPALETFDAAYVKKLRDEAASYRQKARDQESRLTELEARVKADDDAKLSEQERIAKRLAETEAKVAEAERKASALEIERQQMATQHAVVVEAGKLGIVDPDAAYRLLDLAALEFDDLGKPTNVREVLTELVKTKTYLVSGSTGASPTNPPRGSGEPPKNTEADIRAWLYGTGGSFFDPVAAKARGGGVVFTEKKT